MNDCLKISKSPTEFLIDQHALFSKRYPSTDWTIIFHEMSLKSVISIFLDYKFIKEMSICHKVNPLCQKFHWVFIIFRASPTHRHYPTAVWHVEMNNFNILLKQSVCHFSSPISRTFTYFIIKFLTLKLWEMEREFMYS